MPTQLPFPTGSRVVVNDSPYLPPSLRHLVGCEASVLDYVIDNALGYNCVIHSENDDNAIHTVGAFALTQAPAVQEDFAIALNHGLAKSWRIYRRIDPSPSPVMLEIPVNSDPLKAWKTASKALRTLNQNNHV